MDFQTALLLVIPHRSSACHNSKLTSFCIGGKKPQNQSTQRQKDGICTYSEDIPSMQKSLLINQKKNKSQKLTEICSR